MYGVEKDKGFGLLMDFSLHKGDCVMPESKLYVLKEDTVKVNGIDYRRLAVGYDESHPGTYWVEGVGARSVRTYLSEVSLPDDNSFNHLEGCYDNGNCVFDWYDFTQSGFDWGNYEWTYSRPSKPDEKIKMRLSGNEEIEGKCYKKCYFFKSDEDFDAAAMLPDAYVREEGRQYFMILAHNDESVLDDFCRYGSLYEEKMIYDFNLKEGDSYDVDTYFEAYDSEDSESVIISHCGTKMQSENTYFRYQETESPVSARMEEWIGVLNNGLFPFPFVCKDNTYGESYILVEFRTLDGELLYGRSMEPEGYAYKPMLEEGKTWWYSGEYSDKSKHSVEFGITIKGKRNLDGKEWSEIHLVYPDMSVSENPYCLLMEQGKKVYFSHAYDPETSAFDPDGFGLGNWLNLEDSELINGDGNIYDFNLSVGEMDFSSLKYPHYFEEGEDVVSEQYLENSGLLYRRLYYSQPEDATAEYLVEGVGRFLQNDDPIFCAPFIEKNGETRLRWVTDAEKRIVYEGIGGYKLWSTDGVESVSTDALCVSGGRGEILVNGDYPGLAVYDTTGRRYAGTRVPAGLYMVTAGGRTAKVLVK
jgi:hypothetical protein